MKKFLVIAAMLLMASPAWAANTIVYGNHTVGLSAIDSNYDFGADSTLGSPGANAIIDWIQFRPSAAGDIICILDGAAAAKPVLMHATSVDGSTLIAYIGKKCRPYLVVGSCTFGTAANVRVTIAYRTSVGER